MARALVNVLYIERIYVLSSNNTSQTYSCAHIRLEKKGSLQRRRNRSILRAKITKIKFSSLGIYFSFLIYMGSFERVACTGESGSHVSWYREGQLCSLARYSSLL